jgi:thiol-disulfide isomerase/thioredoxin/protocatechuate 3,4-dioxygenase beta subunit
MNDIFGPGSESTRLAISMGLDLAWKSTVVLLLGLAIHAALGPRRVLARSAAWNAALAGLLVLVAAVGFLPRLRVGGLARFDAIARPIADGPSDDSTPARRGIEPPATIPGPDRASSPDGDRAEHGGGEVVPSASHSIPARRHLRAGQAPSELLGAGLGGRLDRRSGLARRGLILAVYGAVGAFLVLRLLGSLAAVARLRRRCLTVDDRRWRGGLERWRTWLGIVRPVELGSSDGIAVPVAVGWLRPAILLPAPLVGTEDPRMIDAVLLHELCHIRRGDYGWNLLRKLVQVVYWPQPLVWLAGPLIRYARERACDEVCVRAMDDPHAYRAALVEAAEGLLGRRPSRGPGLELGLAMARSSRLGRRLADIERSRGLRSCRLSRAWRWSIGAAAVATAGLLGALEGRDHKTRAGTVEVVAAVAPQAQTESRPADAASQPVPEKAIEPSARPAPDAVELTVQDATTGRPIAGATIRNWIDYRQDYLTTDDRGRVRIPRSTGLTKDHTVIDVWGDGYIQQRFGWGPGYDDGPVPEEFTVKLLPGEATYGGVVKDEQGRPIAGVKVVVWGYLKEKKDPHELCYMVHSTTDAQGRWRNHSLREMTFIHLYLSHPDFLSDGGQHARTFGGPSDRGKKSEPELARLRDQTNVQVMGRGVVVRGQVLDEQGRPIAGALVVQQEGMYLDEDAPRTTSDAAGRFRFPHTRPGSWNLMVQAPRFAPDLRPIKASPETPPIEFRLFPARVIRGRVTDPQGRPIPDVFVRLSSWRFRFLDANFKALTDADGRFRWDDAPADPFRFGLDKSRYLGLNDQEVPGLIEEVTYTLTPAVQVSGKVRDAASKELVNQHVQIEKGNVDPETGEVVRWARDDPMFVHQGYLTANIVATNSTSFKLRITSAGYEPFVSRVIRGGEGSVKLDVELKKLARPAPRPSGGPTGVVLAPDGKPLAGARVVLATRSDPVSLSQGHYDESQGRKIAPVETGADGRFAFEPVDEPFKLAVIHDRGFARVSDKQLAKSPEIRTAPWGRVEGQLLIRGRPGANQEIRMSSDDSSGAYWSYKTVKNPSTGQTEHQTVESIARLDDGNYRTQTDDRGRFVFERVPPIDAEIRHLVGRVFAHTALIKVEAGGTTHVVLGGPGRPVIGRLVVPEGTDRAVDFARVVQPTALRSEPWGYLYPTGLSLDEQSAWVEEWWNSPEGKAHRGRQIARPVEVLLDGTFRAEDVPAGSYRIQLEFTEVTRGQPPRVVATASHRFTVAEMPGGRSDEPLDLGKIPLEFKALLEIGQVAPPFVFQALDGRKHKLGDFRGRFILLDFWATWCGPCIEEIPHIKAVRDAYGKDDRLVIISLSLDEKIEQPRDFLKGKDQPWIQGFLGEWSKTPVPRRYEIGGIPAIILIGPDGKVVAKDLRGDAIKATVARSLRKP